MGMTSREVMQTLLRREIPDRMGLNEHFWPFLLQDTWSEQGLEEGTDVVARFGLDIRMAGFVKIREPRPDLAETLEESEEWVVRKDGWGAVTKKWKRKSGTPEHIDFTLTDPEIWARDFREAVRAVRPEDCIDIPSLREGLAWCRTQPQFSAIASLMNFEVLRAVLGDVCMLESLLLEPEWIHDFNTVVTDKYIEIYDYAFREAGLPDGVHVFEDLGYTQAAFISPACHREMILPYHKRMTAFFKDHGLPIIFHTCGDFRPHLPSMAEAGFDCIQAMEAKTGMNVVELADEWKDTFCFMGNLDIRAFESGDRQTMREEILPKLEGVRKKRAAYVFMSDHSIPPSVTLNDYEYALELYREHGHY